MTPPTRDTIVIHGYEDHAEGILVRHSRFMPGYFENGARVGKWLRNGKMVVAPDLDGVTTVDDLFAAVRAQYPGCDVVTEDANG